MNATFCKFVAFILYLNFNYYLLQNKHLKNNFSQDETAKIIFHRMKLRNI